uniref:Uncharacterized protein n=1 Tax=Panagrolaimus sp. JU765 TaxID=591449 RepID=A0AC34QH85_9BILA
MGKLDGKVAVVTGSSSGIGQAVILAFAKEGAAVVLHGTNSERIQKTNELLQNAGIGEDKILVVQGLIQDEATQNKIIDETIKKFGKLDILVNNAAVSRKPDVEHSISVENLDYLYEISYKSMFNLTEKAIPFLKETRGVIINTSSCSTNMTTIRPDLCAYAMIKTMTNMFTTYQAERLKEFGIRVNAVLPGPFETSLLYTKFKFPLSEEAQVEYDRYRKTVLSNIPVGQFGDFDGIAQVYLQMAVNPLVTNAQWLVDGGVSLVAKKNGNLHVWDEIQL